MRNSAESNVDHPLDSDGLAYGIDGSIERLHRLAVRIRQSSKAGLPERVRAFAEKNPDGPEQLISKIIKFKYTHPSMSEGLLSHLIKTVMYRYQRLMYEKRHQGKLGQDRDRKIKSYPDIRHNTGKTPNTGTGPRSSIGNASVGEPYSETAASSMNTKIYNQYDYVNQTKRVSIARSTSSSEIGKVVYPAPPKNKENASHMVCPFCFTEFPAAVFEYTLSWR
jgi:hypothetical protein